MKSIKFQSSSKEGKRKELEELSPAAKRGMEMFRKGYNCCQSTFGAFYEDLGLDKEQLCDKLKSAGFEYSEENKKFW